MKKRMSIVLLLVAVMMTACGKTNETTVDTNVNKPVEEVGSVKDPVTTPEASEPVSTPEPEAPAVPVVSDKIDRIIDVDIPASNVAEKSDFPELHMYVSGEVVEQVANGTANYATPYDAIMLWVSVGYFQDPEPCWESYMVPHYETTDYGRYLVDIDYQENISYGSTNINIFDSQQEAGIKIEITLSMVGETVTDEQRIYVKQYALMNAEYIKEQVAAWPQDFVPESGTEASAAAPVETASGEIPYGWYICADINKYMNINIEDGEFDVIMFGDSGTSGSVDHMYSIVWVEGNTYSIELSEKYGIATLMDGSIQVTADKDELKMYEGSYIVQ